MYSSRKSNRFPTSSRRFRGDRAQHSYLVAANEATPYARSTILTRLSPVFPFNLLNYAYGVTQVSLRGYFFASWLGMLPGTVMYVYLGSLAGSLATIGTEASPSGTLQWTVRIVGFLATVGVTVYVTRIARRALREKVA